MNSLDLSTVIDSRYYFRLVFISILFHLLVISGCATIDSSQYPEGPYIVSTYPSPGDFNISRYTDINIRFSEEMDPGSEAGFELLSKGLRVQGSKRWLDTNTVLVFRPEQPLESNTLYQGIIRSGKSKDNKDVLGVPHIWMFTTVK